MSMTGRPHSFLAQILLGHNLGESWTRNPDHRPTTRMISGQRPVDQIIGPSYLGPCFTLRITQPVNTARPESVGTYPAIRDPCRIDACPYDSPRHLPSPENRAGSYQVSHPPLLIVYNIVAYKLSVLQEYLIRLHSYMSFWSPRLTN